MPEVALRQIARGSERSTVQFVGRWLSLLSILLNGVVYGQIYPITVGSVTGCIGALVASGGADGEGYDNNEDYTATICSDQPGQSVFLTFSSFDLSEQGPGTDQFSIYNGTSTSAPLIGTFTGDQLQGEIIAATPDNPSGCLTVRFTSNAVGVGIFSAALSCGTPCWPPIPQAEITGENLPALVCADEVFTLDASASAASAGQSIVSYEWDLDDGNIFMGPLVTHAYDEPGQYLVSLRITDNTGCANTQQTTLEVWVGTTPDFGGTMEDLSVCEGATVDLIGQSAGVTWSGLPVVDLGGAITLPDQVGQIFSSQLDYSVFENGATLTNVNDLISICVQMEHSYMGDFVLGMTCPNGQNVNLHQQGGGGTFIGDANDTDGTTTVPGTCWDYCFSPTATLGTWSACSQFGNTPNVMPSSQGTALIPGTYSSVDPLTDLLGCPLNGTWTLTFTDNLPIDNGSICGWSLSFDPSLYPDLTEFTPSIGTNPDSMAWSGSGVVPDPTDPTRATTTITEPGSYDFLFEVTDDFGCSYDTTITITVTPAPVVDVTSILGLCTDPAQLSAEIVAYPPPPEPCDHTLVLNDSFGDGWSGGAEVTVLVDGVGTDYTLTSGATQSFTISIPQGATIGLSYSAGTWNGENSYQFIGSAGNALYTSPVGPLTGSPWNGVASCVPINGPVTYVWTPASGVTNTSIADPFTQITQPTQFQVSVYPNGQPWCTTSDTITVLPPSVLENDSVITHVLCNGDDGSISILTSGLGGPWSYAWTNAQGQSVRTTVASNGDTYSGPAGAYSIVVTEGPNGNNCQDTLMATLLEPAPLVWTGVPSDSLICLNGSTELSASASGGTAPIVLQWSEGLFGNGPHSVSPITDRTYTVQAIDANGCTTSTEEAAVSVRDSITFDAFTPFDQCSGVPFTINVQNTSGGNGAYSFAWNTGAPDMASLVDTLYDDANICVTVTDACETPSVTSCAAITVLHTPPFVITADTALGCAPFLLHFALQDTTGGAQVAWDFGNGVVANGTDDITYLYPDPGTFDVTTTVEWPNGCTTDTTMQQMVRVIPVPAPDFSWTPSPLTIFEPVAQFTELAGPNEVSYAWDFFEFGTSDEPDPIITFPNDQGRHYPVQLIVANELGCADTVLRSVHVEDEFLVYVPNAFSPNGDGVNETFAVEGNDISPEEFQLVIFDRWGHEVFATDNALARWSGTSGGGDGEVLPQGVYNWRLKVRSKDTLQKRIIMGHVTLLR